MRIWVEWPPPRGAAVSAPCLLPPPAAMAGQWGRHPERRRACADCHARRHTDANRTGSVGSRSVGGQHGRCSGGYNPKSRWGIVVDQGVCAGVAVGRPPDHQRTGPSGHVPEEIDVPHVKEALDEKPCASASKHPHEETVAAGESDKCGHSVLVGTRQREW
jgi:hypothetical protein